MIGVENEPLNASTNNEGNMGENCLSHLNIC